MVVNYETEIEILLFDQEKIVTYKELNNRFNITPKEAQEILLKFIQNKRKEDSKIKIHVTYLVIGEDKNNQVKKINLVNEEDLKTVENDLKVLTKHVYSIQKRNLDDFNFIYSNDIDSSNNIDRKSNLKIVYSETIPNSLTESTESKTNVIKAEADISKLNLNKPTINNQKENIKEPKVKDEPSIDTEIIAKKPKLNTELEKEENKNTITKPQAKKLETSKPASKHQSTLTSFFKKA